MSKPKRPKQTAHPKMHERTIVFAFPAKGHEAALNQLLATLQEDIYSTHAQLVFSEDGMQAKIKILGNTVQMNNLDGFLRSVAGVKSITEDLNVEMVQLITCYYQNLWDELTFPHEEMHLSAFIGGLAMRQALLDYPDWHSQSSLWQLGEVCYQSMEESHLFTGLTALHEMLLYSFVGGYLGERGTCELALGSGDMRETVKLKAQVLVTEEKGRPDVIVHTFVEHLRDRLLTLGKRNLMEAVTND